jgi:hypothetical protein
LFRTIGVDGKASERQSDKQQATSNKQQATSGKRKAESGKRKAESGKRKAESNKASKLGKRCQSERVNKQNETQGNRGVKSGCAIVPHDLLLGNNSARETMDFDIYKRRLLSNISSCKARDRPSEGIPLDGLIGRRNEARYG